MAEGFRRPRDTGRNRGELPVRGDRTRGWSVAVCCAAAWLAAAGSVSAAQAASAPARRVAVRWANLAMQSLLAHYWNRKTKEFRNSYPVNSPGNNYWWQANAIDALAEGVQLHLHAPCSAVIRALFHSLSAGGTLLTQYFDDEDWMGVGLLHAFRATRDREYLDAAQELFADVYRHGWSPQGGIRWSRDSDYRNTAANATAALLGASLYLVTGNQADVAEAERIYRWEWTHLVASDGTVWDGWLHGAPNKSPYSYNYGTVIGASIRLWQATRDPVYLRRAELLAARSVQELTAFPPSFLLLLPEGQGDGGLFHGIYVRYLVWLVPLDPRDRLYRRLIQQNAERVWARDRTRQNLFGPDWTGYEAPQEGMTIDLSTELSGVFLMNAQAALAEGTVGR